MKGYLNIAFKGLLVLLFPFLILFLGLFFDFFGKQQDTGIIQESRAPFLNANIEDYDKNLETGTEVLISLPYQFDK